MKKVYKVNECGAGGKKAVACFADCHVADHLAQVLDSTIAIAPGGEEMRDAYEVVYLEVFETVDEWLEKSEKGQRVKERYARWHLRERAMAKLTPEELKALGIQEIQSKAAAKTEK